MSYEIAYHLEDLAYDARGFTFKGDRRAAQDAFLDDAFLRPGDGAKAKFIHHSLQGVQRGFLLRRNVPYSPQELEAARGFVERFGHTFAVAYRGLHKVGLNRLVIPSEHGYFQAIGTASRPRV